MANPNKMTLAERVQSLPQELSDMIQAEVFKITPCIRYIDQRVKVNPYHKYLKAPDTESLFLVSSATRTSMLAQYYDSVFICAKIDYLGDRRGGVRDEHRRLVHHVLMTVAQEDIEIWQQAFDKHLPFPRTKFVPAEEIGVVLDREVCNDSAP